MILSFDIVLLVAAVLAPTDPMFASAIVGRIEIPAPISDHLIPIRPGDNTPRIINDWGQ
ncbi:NhaP-type Na+/H+ or K+/H+ antiporter [Cryobacterium sp. CAN_C3]|uniref:hypothetical protein n=1 Tax=unclassified Cryobacterium TaxID=2649013 RepID=UPI0018CA765E|nr:hypothetical protein [Cryobacterium sp. CAN_C3]MEC5154298.1 NhaP-type Na+/H+ or K+/H+ antiporter [Cryobacterium sp. CAN_C3]